VSAESALGEGTEARRRTRSVEVLVVGAGPAGLAAAADLARAGIEVEVLERESEPGGIPRHSHHAGYGLRDLHRWLRPMTGPAYARCWTTRAVDAGARVRTSTSVTGWASGSQDPGEAGTPSLDVVSPDGLERVRAAAVLLATGARERPRSARLVAGSRPAGVYTTGQLQQAVHLHRQSVGRRAVVVGAEHVSYCALLTLAQAGVEVVALVTPHPRTQTFPAFAAAATVRWAVPVLCNTEVVALHGRPRLTSVEVRHDDGRSARIAADTVVFTADWIPDHELARRAGLPMAAGSRAPIVDTGLRTPRPGVFAAGNLVHPVHTADVVALAGQHAARSVRAWTLSGRDRSGWPAAAAAGGVRVEPGGAVLWVAPGLVPPSAAEADGARTPPPRGRFTIWLDRLVERPVLTVRQGGRVLLYRSRRRALLPGRAIDLPADWLDAVLDGGPPITMGVEPA